MEKDLVSVVMATYNEAPDMIRAAINSIVNQTYRNFELLIFDDSTNEMTKKVIDSFTSDERVRVYRYSERVGFVKSLNLGLKEAKGKYIARMDGDDIAYLDRLAREIKFLESNPSVSVVGGQINIINNDGDIISSRTYPLGGVKLYLFSAFRNPLAHSTVMIRRTVIDSGFYYDESLKMSEDLDLWLRLLNHSIKIANISQTVLDYRISSNFIEKRSNRVQVEYMANVRKKNFNRRHLFHSVLSVFAGWLFTHTPTAIIRRAYKIENKQNVSYIRGETIK